MTATHTHTASSIGGVFLDTMPVDHVYATNAWKNIVSAVCYAQQQKVKVRIGACSRINRDFLHNRRLEAPDGTVVQNWANPADLEDCIEPDMIDPELIVFKLIGEDNKEVAFIVNYAMHNNAYTGSGNVISADFAGSMGSVLKKVYGENVAVLFMPGAGGDTNCYDHKFKYPLPEMQKERHIFVGRSLSGTIQGMDAFYEFPENTDISVVNSTIKIEERPYRPLDDIVDRTFGNPKSAKTVWDVFKQVKEQWNKEQLDIYDFPVGILTFGNDMAIITVAGELFTELGMKIKALSPFKYTMVWELTNGYYGYIPTLSAFEKIGYETRKFTINSFLNENAGEMIVNYAVNQLKLLHK